MEKAISKDKKHMSVQTGQSIIQCNENVHDLVLFISKQMQSETHPIRATIDLFKERFLADNMVLLCRQVDSDI